jgi:hypothetical protein
VEKGNSQFLASTKGREGRFCGVPACGKLCEVPDPESKLAKSKSEGEKEREESERQTGKTRRLVSTRN